MISIFINFQHSARRGIYLDDFGPGERCGGLAATLQRGGAEC